MYSLGVTRIGGKLCWALLRMEKSPVVERMEMSDEIPPEVLAIQNLRVVTGLSGSLVLRRDIKLPLTSEHSIRKALPFQLEPLLPFPLDQSAIYTQLHRLGKETLIVSWAATAASIQKHKEEWGFIDPDVISSESLALARWTQYSYPESKQIIAIHGRVGVAIDQGVVVCAMESSDSERLKLFLQQKYPLYTVVEKELEYAIPQGLALEAFEKNCCQFRPDEDPSQRKKLDDKQKIKRTVLFGLGIIASLVLLSETFFRVQEVKIKKQIATYLPHEQGPLKDQVQHLRSYLIQETKANPPPLYFPPVQEILAWLSSFKAAIEINHLEYDALDEKGVVTIEFDAPDSSSADFFVKELKSSPTFVESTQELKWISLSQGYKLSFQLRKKS